MTSTAGWKKCFAIIHVFLALVIMAAAASASFLNCAQKSIAPLLRVSEKWYKIRDFF